MKAMKLGALCLMMFAFGLAPRAQAAYTDDCITFSSASSFTLKTYNTSKNWDGTLWTSTDKTNWTEWNGGQVSAAQTGGSYKLYVRGNASNTMITDGYDYRWVLTGSHIACTGNIETLRGATGNAPSPTKMADFCYSYMFYGCTTLTAAPALPATTLASYCYRCMFAICTALTAAPALPATTLAEECYSGMFYGCTALATAPALPATTLADFCYSDMFSCCSALTAAPALPATTLAERCYGDMFGGCTALTTAPTLPATTLASYCYCRMFAGCTALTAAPALPATTLATDCYYYMFYGCTSLTAAPALPATTLAVDCYHSMFYGCTSLTEAPALPATTLKDFCYYRMFEDCTALEANTAAPGKEWKIPATSTTALEWGAYMFEDTAGTLQGEPALNTMYYIKSAPPPEPIDDCITFSSADAFTLQTNNGAKNWNGTLWTSTDKANWTEWEGSQVAAAKAGNTYNLYVRGDASNTKITGYYSHIDYRYRWVLTGSDIACTGNIETLRGATGNNPSPTALGDCCYHGMFAGCTALTAAPALPATTLATDCYSYMFYGCTSLTAAPALPATTLAGWCYESMFRGCTSLTAAPALPVTTLAKSCYGNMFAGCTSLTAAPALPATTLADFCYYAMFVNCTALTNAPALPATTLAYECYFTMFFGCTALATAPALPATTLAHGCYESMFSGCTALTAAPATLPATTLAVECYSHMFYGCTALTNAPALPATTLADYCYHYMFYGCTALEVNVAKPGREWKIPVTGTSASQWGTDMFTDTAGTLQGAPALNTTYYVKSALPLEPIDDCITFSSASVFTLQTANTSKNWDGTLWTSTDKTNWTLWKGASVSAAQTGDTYNLYVRGNASNTKITDGDYCWVLTGSHIACTGNIETLRGATGNAPSPTKMASDCYYRMFSGCTALTTAPALPAMTLADGCYEYMFFGCTALTNAPVLPATTLAESCYAYMFSGCTSLTEAPALPATTLAWGCYQEMFYGCTSLTEAPALPATTLASYCYCRMFAGCTTLEVNKVMPGKEWKIPATATATNWGMDMFSGTKGTMNGTPDLDTTYYIISSTSWRTDDCITFSSASVFTLETANTRKNWDGTLWTSTDKTNWTVWKGASVSAAQTGGTYNLYVRGNASNAKITGDYGCRWFLAGGAIACSGNIETLRGATGNNPSPTEMAAGCYYNMFRDCYLLATAPALPATTLATQCYAGMFWDCTALTAAPALPATEMAEGCYQIMFRGCTSLTAAPALPATTLAYGCYQVMFYGCTSLTNAPVLPATTLAYGCYYNMFNGCTALKSAPALPATTMAEYCYGSMFSGCTSLTTPPALPATTLASYCYYDMFNDCTALTAAPALPATTLAHGCYHGMFRGCTSLEVNVAKPGKEWKIPVTSTSASQWGTGMFTDTAGMLQGEPALNTTYYVKSACVPGSEDYPWPIGAGTGDTVEAWTNGTGMLVVEGAGKMKAFASDGSDIPWPAAGITAVDISGEVTGIGQNAWRGLDDGVTYNGLSAAAAKTMGNGFGGTAEFGRTAFREFLVDGGSIQATVALETAKSLTNDWTEVELKTGDVSVENGRIVIQHEAAPQSQGFYLVQPVE